MKKTQIPLVINDHKDKILEQSKRLNHFKLFSKEDIKDSQNQKYSRELKSLIHTRITIPFQKQR